LVLLLDEKVLLDPSSKEGEDIDKGRVGVGAIISQGGLEKDNILGDALLRLSGITGVFIIRLLGEYLLLLLPPSHGSCSITRPLICPLISPLVNSYVLPKEL